MPECAISLQDVTVSYREDVALKNVSLEIRHGELLGIVGPNGAGKTTILTVINGMGRLLHGKVTVLGYQMQSGPRGRSFRHSLAAARLRQLIGFVPQGLAIDPRTPVNVREAVMMGRYGRLGLGRRPGKEDWAKVDRLLAMVNLRHLATRPFGHLSGGEQQRVAIARALAQEPRILLLDEPTTFLDWRSQEEIQQLIFAVHRELGLTTLLVTHDHIANFKHCDRVILLKSGEVVGEGLPVQVLSPENLQHVYGNLRWCGEGGL